MSFDISSLDKFPTLPGVYLMKNQNGLVIYVGKAIDLRARVKQYFIPGRDGRFMVPYLIKHVTAIDTIVVPSEKEALLLENNLIKQHRPKYNALLKDDKTYIAIRLNNKHPWPSLHLVRYKGKPPADGIYFGPYTSAAAARQTYELLNKLFPLRQCSDAELLRRTRPCILYGLKRCIAPCVNKCTPEEYKIHVDRTVAFLRGYDKEVVKDLQKEMLQHASALEFEEAARLQRTIQQIETTVQQQNVDMPRGGDADAYGIYREADEVVICQLFIRHGKLTGSRCFSFSNNAQMNDELLESFLLQHYDEQNPPPSEVIVADTLPGSADIAQLLTGLQGKKVDVYTPQRGPKHAIVDMAVMNAKSYFEKQRDATLQRERILLELQEKLKLKRYPQKIECFDNSHIAGSEHVSALVCYNGGFKDSKQYRTYKCKEVTPGDDYDAMREVLMRRYARAKEENNLPDLVVVDGGKGHLNIALKVFEELNIITLDVIAVAKEEARHDKGSTQDEVFLPNVKDPVIFHRNSPVLFLLQEIRDEAHRFVINFHRKRRSKKLVKSSLEEIPGIGPVKKKALLIHFGSVKAIKAASEEEWRQVPGISDANVTALKNAFKQ